MIIVAPTKKASTVAGRETNSSASSLHQLLYDYGWRWTTSSSGSTEWTRLLPGSVDGTTGAEYRGPRIAIRPGDRIVVDEAGMLDLEAANALLDIIERTWATIAVVGDDYQALPVGHSGAMALFRSASFAEVELSNIHRFRDPDWADLTLRLRDADGAEEGQRIAEELIDSGHATCVTTEAEAHQTMVDRWFDAARHGQTIALVTATHAEAQQINDSIQTQRLASGELTAKRHVLGQSDQSCFVGDVVQTRRNDSARGVENRQTWTIKSITKDHVLLASLTDSSHLRKITHEYAGSHLHLGYASTVYGVQGETTERSIVGPGVDAAGLYVGLTRGRGGNEAIVIAGTKRAAISELADTMLRRPREETLEKSRIAARRELARASRTDPTRVSASTDVPSRSLSF